MAYIVTLNNVTGPDVVSLTDGTTYATLTVNANAISPVVADTSPQLGGDLDLNSNDITGTGNINITGTLDTSGNVTVGGNLTVNGTTTTINSTTLTVDDLNVVVASGAADAAAANGAGLTVDGANATLTYVSSGDKWALNKPLDVTGTVTATGFAATGNLTFGDNNKAIFGAGSDLQIYHDGSNSYIDDAGTGVLNIRAENYIALSDMSNRVYLTGTSGGAVGIRFNDSQKLATTSTGVDVTGTVTADGLNVDNDGAVLWGTGAGRPAIIGNENTDDMDFYIQGNKAINISGGGDISFYEDTGTTPKFFWDASTERLGIGNAAPTTTLDVTGTVTADGLTVDGNVAINYTTEFGVDIQGPNNRLRITEPNSNDDVRIISGRSGSGVFSIATNTSGANRDRFAIANNGDISFYEDTGTTPKFFWDASAEALGIGTSLPIYTLDVRGQVGIEIYNGTGGGDVLNFRPSLGDANKYNMSISSYDHSGGGVGPADGLSINGYDGVSIATGSSTVRQERLRIDASGNLLVGKTDTTAGVAGAELRETGLIKGTVAGNDVAIFRRLSTDGDIVKLQKDGTTVGSIGAKDGDIYIGTGDTQLRFNDSSDDIRPSSTDGTGRDAAIDLGDPSIRFKDLYLSGGVYLGGTGAANLLDDYEEGTWTPATFTDWTVSPTFSSATYTKIGRQVTLFIHFATGTTGSQAVFSGVPFSGNGVGAGSNGSISDMGHVFVSGTKAWFTLDNTSLTGARFTVTYTV